MKKKTITIIIVVVLSITTLMPALSALKINQSAEKNDTITLIDLNSNCYGLIFPLKNLKNVPFNSLHQSVSNMINDLLRLNISVYWSTLDFSALSVKTNELVAQKSFFNKGSFIIPFTGDLKTDKLIASVVNDYESKSEIEDYYPIEMYHLMESFTQDLYPLQYAKLAYHFGKGVHYWLLLFYLDTFLNGGLYDHEVLPQDEIHEKLNNKDFDLFVWSGANLADKKQTTKTALNKKASESIRQFVANGGGYVGSCYGSFSASSGVFIPFNIIQHYFRRLPSPLWLSLTSSRCSPGVYTSTITVNITNNDHPVTFGLDKIQKSTRSFGPTFPWLGKDTEALATLEYAKPLWLSGFCKKIPKWIIDRYIQSEMSNPIWITSTFGKGKVVVFGDHPELNEPYRLDRLLHNTVFYTTAKNVENVKLDSYQSLSTIKKVYTFTNNLTLTYEGYCFNRVRNNISSVYDICKRLDALHITIINKAIELMDEGRIDYIMSDCINTEYRDTYQRWLKAFEESIDKLEIVYNTITKTEEVTLNVEKWENETLTILDKCIEICNLLLEKSQYVYEKLLNEIDTVSYKSTFIDFLYERGEDFRKGYQFFIKLFPSAVKLYRNLWYNYEADIDLPLYQNNEQKLSLLSLSDYSYDNSGKVYVNDDAPAGGNGNELFPYNRIQDAIDAANDNDIIFVDEGVYQELISVYKSLTLVGKDKNTTIIDGNKKPRHVVTTNAPKVEITGFTIRNSANEYITCGILLQSSDNLIHGNIFINNRLGVGLRPFSMNNTITNNIAINNSFAGIGIDEYSSINNTISDNILINNNYYGLYVVNCKNYIINNIFINDGITIDTKGGPLEIEFQNNTINNKPIYVFKDKNGFVVNENAGQIILSNCDNVLIENMVLNEIDTGIYVMDSTNVVIADNILTNNLAGVHVYSSNNIRILNNQIENNSCSGIRFFDSNENQIKQNIICYNDDGIQIAQSKKNLIESNTLTQNIIGCLSTSESKNNNIVNNNFMENNKNAYDGGFNLWQNNYWDDWRGLDGGFLLYLPYKITGRLFLNFDWHPAFKPYDIPYYHFSFF